MLCNLMFAFWFAQIKEKTHLFCPDDEESLSDRLRSWSSCIEMKTKELHDKAMQRNDYYLAVMVVMLTSADTLKIAVEKIAVEM